MLGRIQIEFQYLKRYGKNFNVLMFGKIKKNCNVERIRLEFQCFCFQYLKRYDQNSNVCKDKKRDAMLKG